MREPSVSFEPLLSAMADAGLACTERKRFKQYVAETFGEQAASRVRAIDYISVQSWSDLRPELKARDTMVFRLGQGHFALARAGGRGLVDEFFLDDSKLFSEPVKTYVPDVPYEVLYAYQLLTTIQESGAVNFAIASGLLGHVLRLDRPFPRVAPAKGASIYDFIVKPSRSRPEKWEHVAGQVEIDSVFLARRRGNWKIFVIEAKHGKPGVDSRLPKYKLAYPALVLTGKRMRGDLEIIPVYLRSWIDGASGDICFGVAECKPFPRDNPAVADIEVDQAPQVLTMPIPI